MPDDQTGLRQRSRKIVRVHRRLSRISGRNRIRCGLIYANAFAD